MSAPQVEIGTAGGSHWERKPLGEVCTLIKRGIAPKYVDEGGVRVVNQKCVRGHTVNYALARRNDAERKRVPDERLIQPGDVLVNSTGTGTLGRVAQVLEEPSEPTTVDTHVTIVRPKRDKFFLPFFGYAMIFIEAELEAAGHGAVGQTELPRSDVAEKFFATFPQSLEEQKRIVAVLDQAFAALDRARANAEANLADAEELFWAGLDALLSEDVGDWLSGKFNELIGEVSTGPFGSLLHKKDYVDNETPLVNPANIVDGQIEANHSKTVSKDALERLQAYKLKFGDIVIGRRGEMGRCAAVSPEQDGWLCGTGSFFVRPKKSVSSELVAHILRTRKFVERLTSIASGTTMLNLSNKALGDMDFAIPPFEKQPKVLAAINTLKEASNNASDSYRRKIADFDDLRQSILQKAFAGELT